MRLEITGRKTRRLNIWNESLALGRPSCPLNAVSTETLLRVDIHPRTEKIKDNGYSTDRGSILDYHFLAVRSWPS